MEGLWNIMESWHAIGQGIFLIIIAAGMLGTVERSIYYFTVMLQGWPDSGPVEVIIEKEHSDNVVISR
jgi:hypothetical protein